METKVTQIFANLDRWRHLPNYQLERRADIFFSIYLKELVEEFVRQERDGMHVEILDLIFPELPLKTGDGSLSYKVDYFLLAKDRSLAYFVELKTDCKSRREAWDMLLIKAADKKLGQVLEELKQIASKTTSYQKYYHLFFWLAKAELVKLPPDFESFFYPRILKGARAKFAEIIINAQNIPIQILYIQPFKDVQAKEHIIGFDFIVNHLDKKQHDEFGKLFSQYLKFWREQAGECKPNARIE